MSKSELVARMQVLKYQTAYQKSLMSAKKSGDKAMGEIRDNDTSYHYGNMWENRGCRITEICDNGYIVWRDGKAVKCKTRWTPVLLPSEEIHGQAAGQYAVHMVNM